MTNPDISFYSNGKLLLSAEYLVMHGAKALALPINKGQSLEVFKNETNNIKWQAELPNANWFEVEIVPNDLTIISSDNELLASRLKDILQEVLKLNPEFIKQISGKKIISKLGFNPDFGFGSSSTLINNLSAWAGINPYELLKNTFGGSGYDIACASAQKPILFHLENGHPHSEKVNFNPAFAENIYFVWLGNKQSSLKSIKEFNKKKAFNSQHINHATQLSLEMLNCRSLSNFMKIIDEHENFMSGILGKQKVKDLYFTDFKGSVKSLGAWGGDFVMIASEMNKTSLKTYLQSKKLDVIYGFNELVNRDS